MTASDILTSRLRLVAITLDMMRADAAQDGRLASLLGVQIPSTWPPEHWEPHVFAFMEKQNVATPHTAAWNRYVVLREEPSTLIGTMNGFPRSEEEAEIGYIILPRWQRLGLATEGMRAFLEELFRDGTLKCITAQTLPALTASVRVMEKCGFRPDGAGDEEGTVRYRLDRPRHC
jgi:RimJ/RimL family protein N-acetyltransferase